MNFKWMQVVALEMESTESEPSGLDPPMVTEVSFMSHFKFLKFFEFCPNFIKLRRPDIYSRGAVILNWTGYTTVRFL